MKVLIVVGGGGHFSPAMAVIKQMPKEWDVLLVGRKYAFEADKALSLEYQTAQRLQIPFEALTTGRVQRKFTRHTFASLVKIPFGLAQSLQILRRYKPDVVLSFGGYVSVPVVIAAALQRVPIVIHEQTLHAGLANKVAACFATTICLSWSESQKYFPKEKSVLTGNPLRKEFLDVIARRDDEAIPHEIATLLSVARKDGKKVIYITGGSAGAHGINVLIEGCLERLLEKYTVIHQTGDAKEYSDYARLEKRREELPTHLQKRYLLKKFIDSEEVVSLLSQADLVISRSGINTVTELLYLGKPSLLIPLPYGQQNEQQVNATFLQDVGLAQVVDQLMTTPEELLEKINAMILELDVYTKHKVEARRFIHTDAAEKILEAVRYAKEKKPAA